MVIGLSAPEEEELGSGVPFGQKVRNYIETHTCVYLHWLGEGSEKGSSVH